MKITKKNIVSILIKDSKDLTKEELVALLETDISDEEIDRAFEHEINEKYAETIENELDIDTIISDLLLLKKTLDLNSKSSILFSRMINTRIKSFSKSFTLMNLNFNSLKPINLTMLYILQKSLTQLNRDIKNPLLITINHADEFVHHFKFHEYYNLYKEWKYTLNDQYTLILENQITRRGYIDDNIHINTKIFILKNSIKILKDQLSQYKVPKKYKSSLEFMIGSDIEIIYKEIKKADLNYINKEATRYILFESILLAVFKSIKNNNKDSYEHYLKEEKKICYSTLKQLEDFSNINSKNALQYVSTLYSQYLLLSFKKLRIFFIFFFSDNLTQTTNMLSTEYPYKDFSIHGTQIDRRENLPVPPDNLNIIFDFSI